MHRTFAALLVCLFPLLVLAADKPKDLIVGKWESLGPENKGKVLEYKANGNIFAIAGEKSMLTGSYRFIEDDLIDVDVRFKVGDKLITSNYKYRIKVTKDELTTTDQKTKKEQKFKRVP
jgi:hypothetical protein